MITKGNQQWLQYYNQIQFNDRWTLLTDGGYRWRENFDESSLFIVRMGVGYSLRPSLRVGAGMAYLGFYASEKVAKIENRPFQEIQLKNKIGKIELTQRFRLEERFFHLVQPSTLEKPNTFNFRYRYSVMFSGVLFYLSNSKQFVSLKIGDEVFFNSGKTIIYNRFDQNRFVVSPTINLEENLAISLTWNKQFANTPIKDQFISSDVFWLQINQKIVLKKKVRTEIK
ncbi:DUF2490 domain-containing protein [Algoriphagus aestuarii]|nr:DUF2490 domain-containing protein [Algoriphagus aestuarii]